MSRDAAELAHRLAREAEAVCRHYLSNGRREGRYWLVGDVHNTPGRSMFVRLQQSTKGPAGKWTDAATGEHGDLLDIIRESLGLRDPGGRRGSKAFSEAASHRTRSRPKARLSTSTVWITRGRKTTVFDFWSNPGDCGRDVFAASRNRACPPWWQLALPPTLLLSTR